MKSLPPSALLQKAGITAKLFMAILSVCALTALAMGLITRITFQQGFADYLVELEQNRVALLAAELEEEYAIHGNWGFVRDQKNWRKFIFRFSRPGDEKRLQQSGVDNILDTLSSAERTRRYWENAHLRSTLGLLLPDKKTLIAGHMPKKGAEWLPISVQGKTVGWITREPASSLTAAVDIRFHEKHLTAIVLIMVIGIAVAAIAALLMAKTLIAPIKRLAETSNQLANGDFRARVSPAPTLAEAEEESPDKFDELQIFTAQFNQMAAALESHEEARRAFMAEVSHDLRTPLSVLRGELEALEDGVRPLTRESIQSLSGEVDLLERLVGDIFTLALADLGRLTYDKKRLDIVQELALVLSTYADRVTAKNLRLESHLPKLPICVFADAGRITQVIRNILENSMRYTDSGGTIRVSCQEDGNAVSIAVADSPPNVSAAELPSIFDRFHTGDKSRNRQKSGSGLGLAICRTLVEAHQGTIEAAASPLGGLQIRFTLPVCPDGDNA
ncbi:HAMP domain-containing protein [Desulfovibrio sp. OttesenSCG-928-G15]|nr:HAMP domain-containing protein [Desulfovibrio sp. OttesenSCG-928-G15]